MKKIIIYITIFIVVALVVGFYVLNMVGNKLLDVAIENMLDITELDILDEAEIQEVLVEATEEDTEMVPAEDHTKTEKVEEQDKIDTPVATESEAKGDTAVNDTSPGKEVKQEISALNIEEKGNAERNNDGDKPDNVGKTENTGNENNAKKTAFTIDDIEAIKNRVTVEDRIKAALLVLRKLTPADITLLKSMLKGGISVEEKEQAKQLVYSRFNDEEVQQIKEIYRKYVK